MKRFTAILLTCCILLSLCACAPEEVLSKIPGAEAVLAKLPDTQVLMSKDAIPAPLQAVLDIFVPLVDEVAPDAGADDLAEADFPGPLTLWDRPSPTPKPTPEPTPTPSPTPAPPQYVNPLNGTPLTEPYTGRVFASTISNVAKAVPHNGVNQADVVYEMYVNASIIRMLALYSDISTVEAFGGVRSTRPMFHDLVQHFDAVLLHSGGASWVLEALDNLPIQHYNIDSWTLRQANTSFRATVTGRPYENSLMGVGSNIVNYAANDGVNLTQPADKDYGLTFADEGTPAGGSAANEISVRFKYGESSKETIMKYNADMDKYVFWQYTREMWDLRTGEKEAFKNVLIMNTEITYADGYHYANFNQGGDGYFACGGQLIPIKWTCAGQDQPFKYTLEDGSPLNLERGNTYVAIAPIGSEISFS